MVMDYVGTVNTYLATAADRTAGSERHQVRLLPIMLAASVWRLATPWQRGSSTGGWQL